MAGWIKLHRKIRDNPVFNDLQLYRLWTICLLEATHKPHDQAIGKQIIPLEPGQFITGRFDLRDMYNKGLPKADRALGDYTVWRWLQSLEKHGFLSIRTSNKYSTVSITNWEFYQSREQENEQQVSNNGASNEQQVSTNKNGKKGENEKNPLYPEIEAFRKRYESDLLKLIDEYLQFIAEMRKSKRIADSVVKKVLAYFDRFSPTIVEYGIRTHMSLPQKASAQEEYTFGIIRNATEDEARAKLERLRLGPQKTGRRQAFNEDDFLSSLKEEDGDAT
ncbi:hypothetical protein [Paenibacillus sp. RUD330]|uniref:hypothetical protein n=1 Tax=Paenibacillus sp. RUD330 TaxID=2023772 RepID=UPI000B926E19|nr:hypothetical protein [Paenibacillus sp. RUD330]ASS64713.1 hypothetical protein CIC07_00260 [Paenibacillus sp. RUD330]